MRHYIKLPHIILNMRQAYKIEHTKHYVRVFFPGPYRNDYMNNNDNSFVIYDTDKGYKKVKNWIDNIDKN